MTWYDKNLIPQWKIFIDKPYSIQTLFNHKDTILKEISKTQELQHYIKLHRNPIIQNCLMMCLEYPNPQANYNRKFVYPTLAIELLTNQLIFLYLGWQKQAIQHYIHHLFKYFSTVHHQRDNINLYHAYFQRLFKMVMECKYIDKWTVVNSIQQYQTKYGIIDHLFEHSYKYAIMLCLQLIFSIDFTESLICLNINLKKKIIGKIYQVIGEYSVKNYKVDQKEQDNILVDKIEHMLIFLRFYLQRSIKFIIQYTINQQINKEHMNLLYMQKLQNYLYIYTTFFQGNFGVLYDILVGSEESQLKIIIFEILQVNEILYLKARRKEINFQMFNEGYEKIIVKMLGLGLGERVKIYHPSFIDWLLIYFSEVGESKFKADLIVKHNILDKIIQIIKNNKQNTIILTKLFDLLRILFINIQKEIFLTIEHHKHQTSSYSYLQSNININTQPKTNSLSFPLFESYINNIPTLQQIVKQFKTINERLFTFMFKLFKIVNQYGSNIEQIFNHYIQLQVCKDNLVRIRRIIQFPREQPCFAVYQREIGKDLGHFYGEDIFVDLRPVQFVVNHKAKSSNVVVNTQSMNVVVPERQNKLIKLPQNPVTMMKSQQIILQTTSEPSQKHIQLKEPSFQRIHIQERKAISETLISDPPQILSNQFKVISSQNITLVAQPQRVNNEQDQKLRFNKFMKVKINEISTDFNARRTQSKTPTKIKNQLKKAKNKWVQSPKNSFDQPQNDKIPFNGQIKTQRKPKSYSSPKLPKHLADCTFDKIQLIRVPKSRKPKVQKQRPICVNRDSRLMNWLTMLRA